MTNITTRAGAGRPLTYAEMDSNFNNLNSGKAEVSVTDKLAQNITTVGALAASANQKIAQIESPSGAYIVGYGADSVGESLDSLRIPDYPTLRAYSGSAVSVLITGYLVTKAPSNIAGMFVRDNSDKSSVDNGGTVIVAANGIRWKRSFYGSVNVQWFGAVGDGATNDQPSIQAAIDWVNSLPGLGRPAVFIPAARFLITSGLKMYDNIVIHGVPRDIGYTYAFSHSSELIASGAMNCMLDITASNAIVEDLGFYCNNSADYGLYTAVPVGQSRKSSLTLRRLAVTLPNKSCLYLYNLGIVKAEFLQLSNAPQCGIDMSNSGDADFSGLYLNTNSVNATSTVNGPGSSTVYGVGFRIRDASGNINIRGGKVEFNRVGILLNNVDGVNIEGVNFDTNRKASVYIESDNLTAAPNVAVENAASVTSIQITGNRFLGGSAATQPGSASTQSPSTHIYVGAARYVTIVGNGFKLAGDGARDFASDTPQGPDYGIWLHNAELCTIAGNNLHAAAVTNCLKIDHTTPANALHTISGGNSFDGTESIQSGTIRDQASYSNMIYAAGSNPIAQSTAKAFVRFAGDSSVANGTNCPIKSSYNVQKVVKNAAGDYTVTFNSAMADSNFSVQVNVRSWFGMSDAGLYGSTSSQTVQIYTTTSGSQSANGDISVTVFR